VRSRIKAHKRSARPGCGRPGGLVLWFTGLSGSGKSTLAEAVAGRLQHAGRMTFILDGDKVRAGLNRDLGFSQKDRAENIRRVAEVAKLFADCGVICLVAFISPFRAERQRARRIIGSNRFIEIHVATPLAVCEARDVKGLYRKARAGAIPEFTGVSQRYEPPRRPDLRIDTTDGKLDEQVGMIVRRLAKRKR